jgi:UDP-GlcNAc:undecaprenyl-phosphate/decaprenyl-phosphate GlcNAc-1-phosphate transferase
VRWGRLATKNHRGVPLPRVLGVLLAGAAALATAAWAAFGEVGAAGWGALAGSVLVFAAGLVDDLAPVGPRGLWNHLRALLNGRMTTGILKVLVTAGAAVVVVALQPRRGTWASLAGIVLIAAATNVGNGLDVVPGRALKGFLPVGLAAGLAGDLALVPGLAGLLVGSVLALPLDLAERAMLGDSGSNLLGFAAGLGLYAALGDGAVALAAATAVGLNVLAETVTYSRAIEAVAPLRWLDGLGRMRAAG